MLYIIFISYRPRGIWIMNLQKVYDLSSVRRQLPLATKFRVGKAENLTPRYHSKPRLPVRSPPQIVYLDSFPRISQMILEWVN